MLLYKQKGGKQMKKDKDFTLKIVELVIQAGIALAALITAIKS